jgi:hypothetical protein
MTKIKVPARVKRIKLDSLTNWFTQSNAETAAALFGTNTSKIIIALDGNGYMTSFGRCKSDGFSDGHLKFVKLRKIEDGFWSFI